MQRRQTSGGFAGTASSHRAKVITHSIGNVGEMLFITIIMGSLPPVAQCSRGVVPDRLVPRRPPLSLS